MCVGLMIYYKSSSLDILAIFSVAMCILFHIPYIDSESFDLLDSSLVLKFADHSGVGLGIVIGDNLSSKTSIIENNFSSW